MSGEQNLDVLLKGMRPELGEGVFVFCTLPNNSADWPNYNPELMFKEDEGITLVLRREDADKFDLNYVYPSRKITLNIHSSLEAVGFLAKITEALATEKISVNPVSAYYHDHLFVPEDRAQDAMIALIKLTKTGIFNNNSAKSAPKM